MAENPSPERLTIPPRRGPRPTGRDHRFGGRVLRRLVVIAIVALLSVPVLANGQGESPPASGQLEASGRGKVVLVGRLVAFGEVIGSRARIIVRDRTRVRRGEERKATVTLNGEPLEFNRRGRINVRGAEGRFFVQGSRVQVTIIGTQISIATAGRARARLRGRGFYRLNDERTRRWSRRTVRIEPTPPSTNGRRTNETNTARNGSDRLGGTPSVSAGTRRGEAAGG